MSVNLRRSQRLVEKLSDSNNSMDILSEMSPKILPVSQKLHVATSPQTHKDNEPPPLVTSSSQKLHQQCENGIRQWSKKTTRSDYQQQTAAIEKKKRKIKDENSTNDNQKRKPRDAITQRSTKIERKSRPKKKIQMPLFDYSNISQQASQSRQRKQPLLSRSQSSRRLRPRQQPPPSSQSARKPVLRSRSHQPPPPRPVQIDHYFDNTAFAPNVYRATSILPPVYPSHFIHQLPPHQSQSLDAALHMATMKQQHIKQQSMQYALPVDKLNDVVDDDDVQRYQSSSPMSLSESLRDIFQVNDIRELFDFEKIIYSLCEYHVVALAIVLNLNAKSLGNILDAIVQLSPQTVEQIRNVFISTCEHLQCATPSSSSSDDDVSIIQNSPTADSAQFRYFPSQRRTQ